MPNEDSASKESNKLDFLTIKQTALTTVDNPFNPFDDYKNWYEWDREHGYKTPNILASFARTSEELSIYDNALAKEEAIDTILWVFKGANLFKKIERVVTITPKEQEGEGV